MIISKLATDVARGVYAGDAEFFQRDLDKVIAEAIRVAVRGAGVMFHRSDDISLEQQRATFYDAECLSGHVWDDVSSMDEDAFLQASCPFPGGGLSQRCGATLTIRYAPTTATNKV